MRLCCALTPFLLLDLSQCAGHIKVYQFYLFTCQIETQKNTKYIAGKLDGRMNLNLRQKRAPYSISPVKELIHPVTDRETGQLQASCAGVHPRMLTPGWRRNQVGSSKDRVSKRKRERHLHTDAWNPAIRFPQSHCGRRHVIHPKQQHSLDPFPILEFSLERVPAKGQVFQPTPCFQV